MSSMWMQRPKVHSNSCALTLELFIQLEKLMTLLIEYESIWCHSSCFDSACHRPHLYYHYSKIYLPLALGICWHGSTHTTSVTLAATVELMFVSLELVKLRCRVNTVSSWFFGKKKKKKDINDFIFLSFLFVCATWVASLLPLCRNLA